MRIAYWLASPLLLSLAGCAGTMTGLDGSGNFACKAPDGISCASLSGVYANAVQNNLPGQQPTVEAVKKGPATPRITQQAPSSGEPIRSAQKVRRVWLAPWEDDEEVLHDQSYFYLVVDPGRWQVEHSQRRASEGYRPVVPPKVFAPAVPDAAERPTLRMERSNPSLPANAMFPPQGRAVPPVGGEGG